MDGTPFRTSARKRIIQGRRRSRDSAKYTPPRIPRGSPRQDARPTRLKVPTMALAMPPPRSPTGLGNWVKKSRLTAEAPWYTRKTRIRIRERITINAERAVRLAITALIPRRILAFTHAPPSSLRPRSRPEDGPGH